MFFVFFYNGTRNPKVTVFSLSGNNCFLQTHKIRQDYSGQVISPEQSPLHDKHHNKRKTSMLLAGFELKFPLGEWPQTHALERWTTGIGNKGFRQLRPFSAERVTLKYLKENRFVKYCKCTYYETIKQINFFLGKSNICLIFNLALFTSECSLVLSCSRHVGRSHFGYSLKNINICDTTDYF